MTELLDEQEEQVDILQNAQALKLKNLNFFKEFHPSIYNIFCEYVLKEHKVSLITELGQFDILHNGTSIYNNRPIAEAKETIATFKQKFGPGSLLKTIDPPFNTYSSPRFFHSKCNDITTSSPLNKSKFIAYWIPDFYPLMIFNGVGTGYHIENFLDEYAVINCVIMEADPDLFATSLYTVDWKSICKPFLDNRERNIHFIIGPFEKEEDIAASLMGYLCCHCPIYPLTTLFINHNNMPIYKRATEKVSKDTNAFVSIWGYYDDEINQINNCLHNLHQHIPIINPNSFDLLDIPIFIVGAGPSLDDKIEVLKKYKDKAIIVSCGTALHCLYKHGIKPDIQFELESDQCTVTSLQDLGDPEWVRSIPMMGPSQLAPRLYKMFDQKVIFFKAESVTSMLFGNKDTSVSRATPTCTNGAIGIFSHWGFKKIFMFGLDFGYRDMDNHHAAGSIYYTSKDKEFMADADVAKEATMTITAVDGTTMTTKPLLYTAMRSTELLAGRYKEHCTYYNCSNGAAMENTIWLQGHVLPIREVNNNLKKRFMNRQYRDNKNIFNISEINTKLEILEHNMDELNKFIIEQINKMEPNLYSFTHRINDITSFLEKKLKPEVSAFYFFMRGSIWHLLYIGYSHAMAIKDQDEVEQWINTWKDKTKTTLLEMTEHYHKIVFKEFDYDSDTWMTRSASDPE